MLIIVILVVELRMSQTTLSSTAQTARR